MKTQEEINIEKTKSKTIYQNKPRDYVKKRVMVRAIQFDGNNGKDIQQFVQQVRKENNQEECLVVDGDVLINTLEGQMKVSVGDFVIRGVNGEHYPCKPDIFEKTYEPVQPDQEEGAPLMTVEDMKHNMREEKKEETK